MTATYPGAREGRPGHKAAAERMLQLMQRAGGGSAMSPGVPAAPKSELQRKLEEKYAIPPETTDAPPSEAEAAAQRAAQDAQAWPFERPEVPEGLT